MKPLDYWKECIQSSIEELDIELTYMQLEHIAKAVEDGHEHYGMAFYSPPPSERLNEIEGEWSRKYKQLQKEFATYQDNAETAIKRALNQYADSHVSIGKHGEVIRHDGRSTVIQ